MSLVSSAERIFGVLQAAAGGGTIVEVNKNRLAAIAMLGDEEALQSINLLISAGKLTRIPGHIGRNGHPLYWISHVAV